MSKIHKRKLSVDKAKASEPVHQKNGIRASQGHKNSSSEGDLHNHEKNEASKEKSSPSQTLINSPKTVTPDTTTTSSKSPKRSRRRDPAAAAPPIQTKQERRASPTPVRTDAANQAKAEVDSNARGRNPPKRATSLTIQKLERKSSTPAALYPRKLNSGLIRRHPSNSNSPNKESPSSPGKKGRTGRQKARGNRAFEFNKSESEEILEENARKRVARREYYGNLIQERYKAFRHHQRAKEKEEHEKELETSANAHLQASESPDTPPEQASNPQSDPETAIATDEAENQEISFNGPKEHEKSEPASKAVELDKSNPPLKPPLDSEKSKLPAKFPIRRKNFKPSQKKPTKPEKPLTPPTPPLVPAKAEINTPESADSARRTRSILRWKAAGHQVISRNKASMKDTGAAEGLLNELTPLPEPHQQAESNTLSETDSDSLLKKAEGKSSNSVVSGEVTKAVSGSSTQLKTLNNAEKRKTSAVDYQQIYEQRREMRLAKIKEQMEARKAAKDQKRTPKKQSLNKAESKNTEENQKQIQQEAISEDEGTTNAALEVKEIDEKPEAFPETSTNNKRQSLPLRDAGGRKRHHRKTKA